VVILARLEESLPKGEPWRVCRSADHFEGFTFEACFTEFFTDSFLAALQGDRQGEVGHLVPPSLFKPRAAA
jgi:hypothetical protein